MRRRPEVRQRRSEAGGTGLVPPAARDDEGQNCAEDDENKYEFPHAGKVSPGERPMAMRRDPLYRRRAAITT